MKPTDTKKSVFIRRAKGMDFEEFKKVCIEQFEKAGLLSPEKPKVRSGK